MYISLQVNYPLFLSDFHENGLKNNNFNESVQGEPSYSMLADGRTDERMEKNDEANSHFPQFSLRTGTLTAHRYYTLKAYTGRGNEAPHILFFNQLALPPRYVLLLRRRLLSTSVDLDILTNREPPCFDPESNPGTICLPW
jgi:hypothetical protein